MLMCFGLRRPEIFLRWPAGGPVDDPPREGTEAADGWWKDGPRHLTFVMSFPRLHPMSECRPYKRRMG